MGRIAPATEFVGRSEEIARITRLRTISADGFPAAVLVGGDAGVGKTRLVQEIIRSARADGWLVMFGQCIYLGGETMPYAPIVEILRDLEITGGGHSLITPAETELLRLAPHLDPRRPVPDGDPNPIRLFEQMLALVRRLAQDRPLLVVVEDLHWADESTRALLAFLLRHLRASRVLVLGTYRSDDLHRRHPLRRWLSELDRGIRPERMDLHPFGRPELRRLLTGLSGGSVPPETVRRIHDRSGGNAFYAELLHAATYGGAEATSLEEAVRGRLTDLTDGSWSLLSRAAVFRRIEPAMLAAIGRQTEDEVDEVIHDLVDRGILVRVGGTLRFGHELVREVLYDNLLPGERTRLHRQIAEALERTAHTGAAAAELAHHWSAAGVAAKALPHSVRAIQEAMQMSAVAEACTYSERALELWEQVPNPQSATLISRRDVLLSYADAAYLNGTPQHAIGLIRAELLDIQPGDPVIAPLYERLVKCARAAQDPEALGVAEKAATQIRPETPHAVRARLLKVTASAALVTGRLDLVEQITAAGLVVAREAKDDIGELAISIARGYALGMQGRSEGLETLASLVKRAATTGERDAWHRALTSYAFCLCIAGRPHETVQWCDEGLRLFGQSASLRAEFKAYRMGALRWLGRWDELVVEADRVAFDLEMLGWSDLLGAALAPVLVERGELKRAEAMLCAAWEKIRRTPLHALAVPSTAVAASMAAIYAGRPGDVPMFVSRALDLVASYWSVRVPELVAVGVRAVADHVDRARQQGDDRRVSDALAHASSLLAYLDPALADDRVDIGHCRAQMRAWADQAHAELDRAHGESSPAAWAELARAWPALHRPEQGAYAHYRAAQALSRERFADRAAIESALSSARRTASRLGAQPLLAYVETVATRSRVSAPTTAAEPPAQGRSFGLTSREHEVLELIAKGLTNQQIGKHLFISPKTVSAHVSHILEKMNLKSRGQAAQIYHQLDAGAPAGRGGV